MPGSYRKFAVDFDGSGRADLWASPPDIVGSVANFLVEHGWQPGQPVLLAAVITEEGRAAALQRLVGGLSDRQPLAAWAAMGVTPAEAPGALVDPSVGVLAREEPPGAAASASYWIACANFYALLHYNRSRVYASAVWELAKAVKAARGNAVSLIQIKHE